MRIEIGKHGIVDAGKLTILLGRNSVLNSEKIFASSRTFFLANQENWQADEAFSVYPDFSRTYGQSNREDLSYLAEDNLSYGDLNRLLERITDGKYSAKSHGGFVIQKSLRDLSMLITLHSKAMECDISHEAFYDKAKEFLRLDKSLS